MNINDKIKSLSPYFKGLNVIDDSTFIMLSLPQGWKVYNEGEINKRFKTVTKTEKEGVYFFTETQNGVEVLFDAAEYTINENKAILEKSTLLKEKAKELTELFASEPIEKLRTLEFTFAPKKPLKKKKNDAKAESVAIDATEVKEKETEVVEEAQEQEQVPCYTDETTEVKNTEEEDENNEEDSDVMSFVKDFLGEK